MYSCTESANIYVDDQNGPINFGAVKAALFDCHCIMVGNFGKTEEAICNEYCVTVSVPVHNNDWSAARSYFEREFEKHDALAHSSGYWSIVYDGKIQWFHGYNVK